MVASQAFATLGIPRAQAKIGQAAATDHCTAVKPSYNKLRLRHKQVPGPGTARSVQSLLLSPDNDKNNVYWLSWVQQ